MKSDYIIRVAGYVAAFIFLQTLYFKFTGQPESVALFTNLGVEPWGRWATGILELIASILLIYRKTTVIGALMGEGLMTGAIFSHLFVIGISSNGDDGTLFTLAIAAFVCCAFVLYSRFDELKAFLGKK